MKRAAFLTLMAAAAFLLQGCSSTWRAMTPQRVQLEKVVMSILTEPGMERNGVCSFSTILEDQSVVVQFSAFAVKEMVSRHTDGLLDPCDILKLGMAVKARGSYNDDRSVFTATEVSER